MDQVKKIPATTTIAKPLKQADNRPVLQQQQPQLPQQQQHQQQQQQQQQQQNQHQNGNEMNGVNKMNSSTNETHITTGSHQPTHTVSASNADFTEEEINRMLLSRSTPQLPNFGSISTESIQLPPNCNLDDVKKFEELYKDHCEVI